MNKTLKTLTSLAILAGTTQLVHAHAGFKDQITEGTTKNWNAVAIGHGCASNEGGEGVAQKDVIAISAIFPNSANFQDVVIRGSKGVAGKDFTTGEETIIKDLSNDIVGSTTDLPLKASLNVVTANGAMFPNTIPVIDGKGNVRGFQSWGDITSSPLKGSSIIESVKKTDGTSVTTTGLAPFGINAFQFKPESCAKSLKIRVAVANWCEKGAKSYKSPSRVDLWFGHITKKFNEQVLMPSANPKEIFWTTLTVNRDLVKNPLPGTKGFDPARIKNDVSEGVIDRTVATGWDTGAKDADGKPILSTKVSCADAAYDTVYIEPADGDIDTYLPISAAKFPAGANGALYWPTPVK